MMTLSTTKIWSLLLLNRMPQHMYACANSISGNVNGKPVYVRLHVVAVAISRGVFSLN